MQKLRWSQSFDGEAGMSKATSNKKSKRPGIPASHLREFARLLETSSPFRLSDLAKLLLKHVSPRMVGLATLAADRVFKAAAKRGEIVRHGHLHWVAANKGSAVALLSGRSVPHYEEVIQLDIRTRKPEKWAFVDLETGDCFSGNHKGELKVASNQVVEEVAAIVNKKSSLHWINSGNSNLLNRGNNAKEE